MLKTHKITRQVLNQETGIREDRVIDELVLDRRSNEPIVTEDRTPGPLRALPRPIKERAESYATTDKWHPHYQQIESGMLTALNCWKCLRPIVGWAPALRRPAGWRPGDVDELIQVNGQPAVKLTPFNHYREGLFHYRRPDGVLADFSYLHCADCHISDGDGEDLLTCMLVGHDDARNAHQLYTDNFWAQWMWRWSAIELVGRNGASKGPKDLIQAALKRGAA